jgi:hypothetical protein
MARGGPDWYGGLGTTYGTLARAWWNFAVGGDTEQDLVSVTGRGTIVSGFVYVHASTTHKEDQVKLYIDDTLLTDLSFLLLNIYGLKKLETYPVYITRFNNVKKKYAAGIIGGLTFNESFKVAYRNTYEAEPTVVCHVVYSLI